MQIGPLKPLSAKGEGYRGVSWEACRRQICSHLRNKNEISENVKYVKEF